jgi:hypothetical protein
MSRFVTDRIDPGDARGAAGVNAFYDAIEAGAADIDLQNLATEGVSRYNTDKYQKMAPVEVIRENTRDAVALTPGPYTTLVFSGTTFQSGPVTLDDKEALMIWARTTFESTVNAGVGLSSGVNHEVRTRIAYKITGGATVIKNGTTRRTRVVATAVHALHARYLTRTIIKGPIELDYVDLLVYVAPGTTAHASKGLLALDRWRRVS